jgi:RNA polymerase sigma factor (sigma-70 family)
MYYLCNTIRSVNGTRRLLAPLPEGQQPATSNKEKSMNTLSDRIAELEPRIRKIAASYARDPFEADDIYQHMVERILAHSTPEDSNARIYTYARWKASEFRAHEETYGRHVGDETMILAAAHQEADNDTEEGDALDDAFEYFDAGCANPEDAMIAAEEMASRSAAISRLDPKNQQMVRLLSDGCRQVEISRRMGVSAPRISQCIRQIAGAFGSLDLATA